MRYLPLSLALICVFTGCVKGIEEKYIETDFPERGLETVGTVEYEKEVTCISRGSSVFSLNRNRHTLKKYNINKDGRWHLEIEKEIPSGKGPGEMIQPAGITADASGRLLVTDSDMNLLSIYDLSLNFQDTVSLDIDGTLSEGSGMIAAYEANRAVLPQISLQRPGKELLLFDYGKGTRISGFGREVKIDMNRLETFIAATGIIRSVGNTLIRLTYEPKLYFYNGIELIVMIDPNDLLERYNINLAMPGAKSRRVNKKVKSKNGISTFSLLQNGVNGEVYLVIKDLKRKRMLFMEFDAAGNVLNQWQIKSEDIHEDGYTSAFIYDGSHIALYGEGKEIMTLYSLF